MPTLAFGLPSSGPNKSSDKQSADKEINNFFSIFTVVFKNLLFLQQFFYYHHLSRKAEGNGPLKP